MVKRLNNSYFYIEVIQKSVRFSQKDIWEIIFTGRGTGDGETGKHFCQHYKRKYLEKMSILPFAEKAVQ